MERAGNEVIRTEGLTKTYGAGPKRVPALTSLDLSVPRHSIFGFLGPNGAGKTTTMKILLGLARPSQGRVMILGQEAAGSSPALRQRIGYLPQSPRFYGHLTARETLRFAARFYPQCDGIDLEARIDEMLELVGLQDKANRAVYGFSGGERQRLGLAQAQIHHPDLLILDEPAAALDPIGRHDVLRIMESLRAQTTIFYSTHILDDVQQVSDTVAILDHGRLVAQGPIEQLLSGGEMIYEIRLNGAVEGVRRRLEASPWVVRVDAAPGKAGEDGQHHWQIVVSDAAQAQKGILPLLCGEAGLELVAFYQKRVELEAVFLDLVNGARA